MSRIIGRRLVKILSVETSKFSKSNRIFVLQHLSQFPPSGPVGKYKYTTLMFDSKKKLKHGFGWIKAICSTKPNFNCGTVQLGICLLNS
ncbi:hypothetical protein BpHYR1_044292 [Brachionus plicatilis]|uniref:Uncharacterized protein n=1 Tax=Brachionus plicatilis TaxID=10195 RepID=A0A3M7PDD3_BRAPC|nr:hypothetical protein BpHYR1_044292 [Brachionus plicatilis]